MNVTRVVLNSIAGVALLLSVVLIVIPVGAPALCGSALFPNTQPDFSGVPFFLSSPACTSAQNGMWVLAMVLTGAAVVLFVLASKHKGAASE